MIGSLNEGSLHASLKAYYCPADGQMEVPVAGYVIDVVTAHELIEIQTGQFGRLKPKLLCLSKTHDVRLVYPVAARSYLMKCHADGTISRRASPKRGRLESICAELVHAPWLLTTDRICVELILIEVEELRVFNAKKARRKRGWQRTDRRLVRVLGTHMLPDASALLALLPAGLPEAFTTAELAAQARMPRRLAQQMCYCLHTLEKLERVGKRKNAFVYQRIS